MEIALDTLPIPDWGLECPRCRYPLRGLPEHRCPECGLRFEMQHVVKPWTRVRPPRFTGNERPLPDFGLLCGRCKQPLAGAAGDACSACGEPFNVLSLRPSRDWFPVDSAWTGPLMMSQVEVLLASERVPYIPLNSRQLSETLFGGNVVGTRLLVHKEFFFDVLWLIGDGLRQVQRHRQVAEQQWLCATCGEDNPGHFEICWNCEAPRPIP